MKKLIQIWLGLLVSCQVFAQDVNLSTGTGSVTLPIYTLQEGSISVPISVSYDASGVPVNTQASNIGLNWGLIAGGKIVRTVRRYADDGIMELADRQRGGIYYYDDPAPNEKFQVITDTERDIFTLMLNGSAVPFIIRYPTGGSAPQIVYLKQNTDITIELVDVSISRLSSPLSNTYTFDELINASLGSSINGKKKFITFKVTTADGLVYYFGENPVDREYGFTYDQIRRLNFLYPTVNGISESSLKQYDFTAATVNTWNLSRIVKPNVNNTSIPFQEVKFYYKRTQQILDTYGYNESSLRHIPTSTCVMPTYSRITDRQKQPIAFLSQLDKIVSDNFEVRFNDNIPIPATTQIKTIIPDYNETAVGNFTDKSRLDIWQVINDIPNLIVICCRLNGVACVDPCTKPNPILAIPPAEALKNIVVIDRTPNATKKLGYFFHHSYFNVYSLLEMSGGTKVRNDLPTGHLKLLGIYPVKFLSNGGGANTTEIMQGHTFKYNGITLPRKESMARDAWGYYNGQETNEISGKGFWAIGERHPYILTGQTQPQFKGSFCANSAVEPSLEYAQAASLHTIVSPKGGWSEIEYELHDCDNYFTERALVNNVPTKVELKKVGGLRVKNIKTYDPVTTQTFTKKYTYTKKNSSESSGFLAIIPSVVYNQFSGGFPYEEYFGPGVWNQLASTYINGSYISYRFVREETVDAAGNNNGYTEYEFHNNELQPYLIKDANYNYLIEENGTTLSKCYDRYYRLDADIPGYNNIPKFDFLKGSVKSQRVYNKDNKLLSETEYTYEVTDLTNSTVGTNGRMLMIPSTTIIGSDVPIELPWRKQINYVSSGIGYIGTGFQIAAGNAAAISSSLTAQGMGISSAAFAVKSASFANIAATLNGISTFVGVALTVIDLINAAGYQITDNSIYFWRDYKTPVGKVNLTKTVNRTYNMNDANFIETVSEYKFESTAHAQMTSTKQYIGNAGNPRAGFPVYETKIKYNKDYIVPANPGTNDLKGLAGLNALKMLVPIESISLKNSKTIGGSYTEFHPTGTNYVGMPAKSYALEITRPLTSFTMSTVSSGTLAKSTSYVSKVDYVEYNLRGLLSKVKGSNQVAESTTQFSNYNNYLPTASTYGTPALNMTTTNEYIPLFGVTKTTAPDNSFVTTTYDELGRVTAIKDLKGDIRKSFDYKTVLPKQPTLDFGFKLIRSVNNADLIDITNGMIINKNSLGIIPAVPDVNIRIVPPAGIESVVFELQGPISKVSTDSQETLWRVFEDTNGNGFNILDSIVNGSYSLTAKVYSKKEGRGDLIGMKKITFTIQ